MSDQQSMFQPNTLKPIASDAEPEPEPRFRIGDLVTGPDVLRIHGARVVAIGSQFSVVQWHYRTDCGIRERKSTTIQNDRVVRS